MSSPRANYIHEFYSNIENKSVTDMQHLAPLYFKSCFPVNLIVILYIGKFVEYFDK